MEPLTWLMLPLTSESVQRNVFLIQESTVLTSKCNSAPQAAVIPSVIMVENGIEGNQINTGMMDGWIDGGKLVMSVFTLCPFLTCSSPPGSISPNYHTWMLNRRERASVGYESVAHLQGGYM